MSVLSRYLFKSLFLSTLGTTFVLTCIIWLTQSLRFVDIVLNKGLPLSTFFNLVMFLIPDLVNLVAPGAFLISILFVYHRLQMDQELTVMGAVGLSRWQIAKPAIMLASLLTIALYIVSLYILPHSFKRLKNLEHEIRNGVSSAMLQEGVFTDIKGVTIYVASKTGKSHVSGIVVHDGRFKDRTVTLVAQEGSLQQKSQKIRLVLLKGTRQEFNHHSNKPNILSFDKYILDLEPPEATSVPRTPKAYELEISELLFPTPQLQKKLKKRTISLELHQRVLSPLYALTFALLSISFYLSGDYNRRGRSRQIGLAIISCCLAQGGGLTLLNLSEQIPLAIPSCYVLFFISIIASLGYLLRGSNFPHHLTTPPRKAKRFSSFSSSGQKT